MTATLQGSSAALNDAQREWLKKIGAALNLRGEGSPKVADETSGLHGAPLLGDPNPDGQSAVPGQASNLIGQQVSADSGEQGFGKGGVEIELFTREISKKVNYGEFKLGATIKIPPTAGDGVVTGIGTSKEKDGKRVKGAKFGYNFKAFEDLKILSNLDITDISIGVEAEWSGGEITSYAQFKFKIVTAYFNAPATLKVIFISLKDTNTGSSIRLPGIELKVSPTNFKVKIGGVETILQAEYKASFAVTWEKVGKEILEKLAKDKLEKEAKKQGVKMLARKAGEQILTKLGPLATAFGVGWDIGTLLSKYTMAGETAKYTVEDILGDLNVQWQKADTLEKMKLIERNRAKILAALVAAGALGAVTGVGDLILFKLMHLDKLKDFDVAFKKFMSAMEKIPKVGDAFGDMQMAAAIKLGIKFNPKYHTISDPSLSTMTRAAFERIKPIYKKSGGLDELMSIRLYDVDVDVSVHQKIAQLIQQKQLSYTGLNPKDPPTEITDAFLDFILDDYRRFLENNQLISYKVKTTRDGDLGTGSITQELVNELFL
jgi:hypothetical protein